MKDIRQIRITLLLVLLIAAFFQLGRLDLFNDQLVRAVNTAQPVAVLQQGGLRQDSHTSHYRQLQALIVCGRNSQPGVLDNISRILTVLEIDAEKVWLDLAWSDRDPDDFSRYDVIVLLPQYLHGSLPEFLLQYVRQGGKLVILSSTAENEDNLLSAAATAAGIQSIGSNRQASSVFFLTELVSGLEGDLQLTGETLSPQAYFCYRDVALQTDCQVHLETRDGSPLIWQRRLLNGQIMVLNTGHYDSRYLTGLFAGSLSVLLGLVAYPVPAAKVVFIDDFPADYQAEIPAIRSQYGRSYERYVSEIWWPRLLNLLKKHELKPSAASVLTYADQTSTVSLQASTSCALASPVTRMLLSDLLAVGGEVCLHGYNHQPLSCDAAAMAVFGYVAWPDCLSAAGSLAAAAEMLQELMPSYRFQVYLPPSDLFASSEGSPSAEMLAALQAAVPSIQVISGIYYPPPGKEQQQDSFLVEDFGLINYNAGDSAEPAVRKTGLIALPRISAGPDLSAEAMLLLASAAMTEGMISHTIFVDDILDPYRSRGRDCEQLMAAYDQSFTVMATAFSWLESMTASEAALAVKAAAQASLSFNLTPERLELMCDNFVPGQKVIVAIEGELHPVSGCTAVRIDSRRWLIRLEEAKAALEVH